jgi:hypothetical protein
VIKGGSSAQSHFYQMHLKTHNNALKRDDQKGYRLLSPLSLIVEAVEKLQNQKME